MSEREDRDPLERAAEEFLERTRRGEHPDVEEYARRHPEAADEIRALLPGMVDVDDAAAAEAATPERVGHYRILGEIGQGGMGVVYLAEDARLGRRVALKVLGPEFASFVQFQRRFAREAAVAARLDHPGICTVYEAGTADGMDFIAMRFVEGEDLGRRIAARRRAAEEASADGVRAREEMAATVALIEKAARALHTAHEAGLVHRDIKPANIMVAPGEEPVILDFGLARGEGADDARITRSGVRVGTPAYMSPEQVAAEAVGIDRRTDVYSLGVTLYEALTLRLPFDAPTVEGVYRKILTTTAEDPRRHNRALPRDLVVVLETAMARERDRRYASALDLAEDLRRVRAFEPVRAKPVSAPERLWRWAQRNPAIAASVAAAFLSLAAGLAASLHLLGVARTETEDKESALGQVRRERDARQLALDQKDAALKRSRVLGLTSASEAIREKDPLRSVLLAREAVRYEATPEAVGQLHAALAASFERRRLPPHDAPLSGAVFSPSGALVLAACEDGTARLYGVDGTAGAVLRGHGDRVVTAVFSPTGDRVLTSSVDRTARLFDLQGRELAACRGHAARLWGARFSPAGDRVLTWAEDGTARLFDLEGGERAVLRGHVGIVWCAVFSPAGDRVLTGCADGTARVFDLEGREIASFPGLESAVRTVAFSPDGKRILAACDKGHPRLLDPDGTVLATFKGGHRAAAPFAAFSPSGDRVVTASWDKTARLFDLEGKELAVFEGHESRVTSAHFSLRGDRVVTASWDRVSRVYDLGGRARAVYRGHEGPVRSAVFSPDGTRVLTACWDRIVRIFDTSGAEAGEVGAHEGAVTYAVFSPTGDRVLTSSVDGTARLSDLEGREVVTFRGHGGRVWSAAFSPSGDRVVTTCDDGVARIFDLEGREVAALRGHEGPVFTAVFSPDGDSVLTAGMDHTARLFGLDGTERTVFRGHGLPVRSATFSPSGNRVLTASEDETARIFDLDGTERVVFRGHTRHVWVAVFSASEDCVLTAGEDGTARLWEPDGRERLVFRGAEGPVRTGFFSPSGDRIVISSDDRSARVFDLSGRLIAVVRGHEAPLRSAVFSSAGDRLLTAAQDGTARIWLLRPDELLALAESRVDRDLEPRYLQQYADLLDR